MTELDRIPVSIDIDSRDRYQHADDHEYMHSYLRTHSDPHLYGAVGDGVTDDTAPLQAAIDNCDERGVVQLRNLVYSFSHLTNPHPYTVTILGMGRGQTECRGAFGGNEWSALPRQRSTTLLCTATNGSGLAPGVNKRGFNLESLILHGVGADTRTTIGATIGVAGTPSAWVRWRDVTVANFETGIYAQETYEGRFGSLTLTGCNTGMKMNNCNAFTFDHLELATCTIGVHAVSSGGHSVFGGTCQTIYGTGFRLEDSWYWWIGNIHFESSGVGDWDIELTGVTYKNHFVNLYHGSSGNNVYVGAEAFYNRFTGGQAGNYTLDGGRNTIDDVHAVLITDNGRWNELITRETVGPNYSVVTRAVSGVPTNPNYRSGHAFKSDVLLTNTAKLLKQAQNGNWYEINVDENGDLYTVLIGS